MDICGDNRFEIIEKAKQDLLESTNVSSNEDEIKVLDRFLFRCWQMGWLDKYNEESVCEANCTTKSEDLKKEISKWRNHYISVLDSNLRIDLRDIEVTANHFAEWQKQQMYKLLVEQITLNYNSGYEKGLRDKEEEILKDAIDFFYMQINGGDMEIKDIKVFIEQFTKYIKKED